MSFYDGSWLVKKLIKLEEQLSIWCSSKSENKMNLDFVILRSSK